MDRALISSPQLHAHEISALYYSAKIATASEHQILKDCLSKGDSVKVLRLSFEIVSLPSRCESDDP